MMAMMTVLLVTADASLGLVANRQHLLPECFIRKMLKHRVASLRQQMMTNSHAIQLRLFQFLSVDC